MKQTYRITAITLINGTKQEPRKCDIETDNIEQVRQHYKQLYPDYEIVFKYFTIPLDKGH